MNFEACITNQKFTTPHIAPALSHTLLHQPYQRQDQTHPLAMNLHKLTALLFQNILF